MNDLVADALVRIKNGYLSQKSEITLPYSKLVLAICGVLEKSGYIEKSEALDNRSIVTKLKYSSKQPALAGVRKISKPGLRVYKGKDSLPYVLNGLGIAVISTPKGVMTDREARKEGVGGEILAYVW